MSSTSSPHVDGEPSHAFQSVLTWLRRGHGGAPIDACDGSPSTCRLYLELIPEPSWHMPMDTIPKVGSYVLLFRALVQQCDLERHRGARASSGEYVGITR